MNYTAEPADQMVRYYLDGAEFLLKLSGTAAKNFAVFAMAVLKDQKKTHGKTNLVRLLREGKPLKFFEIPADRMQEFAKEANKRGLLFVPIRDKEQPEKIEIAVWEEDAAKVNRVIDKMQLDVVDAGHAEAVKAVLQDKAKQKQQPTEPAKSPAKPEQTQADPAKAGGGPAAKTEKDAGTSKPVGFTKTDPPAASPSGKFSPDKGSLPAISSPATPVPDGTKGESAPQESVPQAGQSKPKNTMEAPTPAANDKPSVRKELQAIKAEQAAEKAVPEKNSRNAPQRGGRHASGKTRSPASPRKGKHTRAPGKE